MKKMWQMCSALMVSIAVFCASPAQADSTERGISLATANGEIQGSLLQPEGSAKVPVVLIIAGSGPTNRNGNSAGSSGNNNSLKMLAEGLANQGYASVRFDKRGVGDSAAVAKTESAIRFETYVDDAAAWLKMLKADTRFSDVVVLGHSEGSLIAMLAAQQVPVSALVSVAGAGSNLADVLRQQLYGKLPPDLVKPNEEILQALQAGKTTASVPPALQFLYRESVQPYLISQFRYTPLQEIRKLTMPVLILQGDTDIQVDRSQAEALKAAKPDAELHVISDMNHVLKIVPVDAKKQMASYFDPTLPVSPELIRHLSAFLQQLPRH